MHRVTKNIVLAPTDLGNFLSCRHLSRRDLAAANGQVKRPVRYGPVLEELRARGAAHETAYLKYLEEEGLSVVRLSDESSAAETADGRKAKTLAAMRHGADVIYQASLAHKHWAGRADFLRRVEVPSALGDWSYEVYDTKLARETRASTVLQLCVYSFLVGKLQAMRPALMHVVTPGVGYEPVTYRADDYAAYFRFLERGLGAFVQKPSETYPHRVSHCDLCAWWSECESRRRADDNLCYVAGISGSQISALHAMGIDRLTTLAQQSEIPDPSHGSREALERVRDQARVQFKARGRESLTTNCGSPLRRNTAWLCCPNRLPTTFFWTSREITSSNTVYRSTSRATSRRKREIRTPTRRCGPGRRRRNARHSSGS